jgi:ABC-type phosphate transport system substrate-binding protein
MRLMHQAAAIGAAVVALAGIGIGTALADPPPGTVPTATDIVGVGAETTGPLFDALAAGSSNLVSFDATGSSPITPKAGCAPITRPNGSNAGINALLASINAGNDCIDFARSSRPRTSSDPSSISFVSLARDAITWSSPAGSNSPVPTSLTVAQMKAIYTCTDTNWNQVGGANAPIVAVLPQSGSGTRTTFLGDLGGGVNTPLVPGPCVINGSNSAGLIEENTGVSPTGLGDTAQFGTVAAPNVDDIFPYSVGDYIAQATTNEGTYAGKAIGGHSNSVFGHGPMVLHNVAGVAPTTTTSAAPYSNATVVNAASFPLQRLLFDVVRTGSPLASSGGLFSSTGWVCTNATAKGDIASYGFLNLGANCGALS